MSTDAMDEMLGAAESKGEPVYTLRLVEMLPEGRCKETSTARPLTLAELGEFIRSSTDPKPENKEASGGQG